VLFAMVCLLPCDACRNNCVKDICYNDYCQEDYNGRA